MSYLYAYHRVPTAHPAGYSIRYHGMTRISTGYAAPRRASRLLFLRAMPSRKHVSRRGWLQGMSALAGLGAIGCTGENEASTDPEKADGPGCSPAATSWEQARNRISSVVVLCMENRSFDHYFGALSLPQDKGGWGIGEIDGLRGDEANVARDGRTIRSHVLEDFTPHDLPHDLDQMHRMFADGRNSGFVTEAEGRALADFEKLQKAVDPSQRLSAEALAAVMAEETMGYHTPDQIPMFYKLAQQSMLCEQWFCSVMGPTWPNRFYLHGGGSKGEMGNKPLNPFGYQSILDVLNEQDIDAQNFYHDVPWLRFAQPLPSREARNTFEDMVSSWDRIKATGFFAKARANKLPALSIIDPHFGTFNSKDANDDHPDSGGGEGHHVRMGQALIASVVKALAENPKQWERTLLIITYDENGGFYDHVAPPELHDERPEFRRLGFRVPSMLVGPYVRRGCTTKTVLDHTSILSSVLRLYGAQKWFDNPEVNNRLNAGNDLLECLDANALEGSAQGAPELPEVPLSLSAWRNRPEHNPHGPLATALRSAPLEQQEKAASRAVLENVLIEAERLGAVKMVK